MRDSRDDDDVDNEDVDVNDDWDERGTDSCLLLVFDFKEHTPGPPR